MRKDMDDAEGLALVHNNLGMLLRDQGRLDEAEKHFRASLEASKPFAYHFNIANATLGLAYLLFLKDDHVMARQMLSSVIQRAEEIDARDILTEAHRMQVEMYIAEGNYQSAIDTARTTLERARETGNREHQASLWRLISIIELSQGHIDTAKQALAQAMDILSSVTNMLESGRAHTQAACIALAVDDNEAADDHLKAAQGIFIKLGVDSELAHLQKLAEYRSLA